MRLNDSYKKILIVTWISFILYSAVQLGYAYGTRSDISQSRIINSLCKSNYTVILDCGVCGDISYCGNNSITIDECISFLTPTKHCVIKEVKLCT
jgi:hypothetical protein